jgi:hypothetical protein
MRLQQGLDLGEAGTNDVFLQGAEETFEAKVFAKLGGF